MYIWYSISLSLMSLSPSLLSLVSYFLPSFSPSLSISHPFIVFLQQQGTKVRVRIPRFLQRKRLPQNTIIPPLVSECVCVCTCVCGCSLFMYNLHTSCISPHFLPYISYRHTAHSTAAHSPGHSLWEDNGDHQIHRCPVEDGWDPHGL